MYEIDYVKRFDCHGLSIVLDKCTDFFVEFLQSLSEMAESWSVCGCEGPTPAHQHKPVCVCVCVCVCTCKTERLDKLTSHLDSSLVVIVCVHQ